MDLANLNLEVTVAVAHTVARGAVREVIKKFGIAIAELVAAGLVECDALEAEQICSGRSVGIVL